jgi:hypothetical protein
MFRAVVLTAALCACTNGDLAGGGGSGSGSDDAGLNPNADAPKLMWVDAAPGSGNNLPCKNNVLPAPQLGHHNTGQDCMSGCHDQHGFTLSGTLYTSATNNTGFAGATISITDNNGAKLDLVVNSNGNFYTKQPIAFPVLVIASSCPSAVKMTLASADGRCNRCHSQTAGTQMHLP